MKKLMGLVAIALLTGCQDEDNRAVSYTMPPSIEEKADVETVRPSVIVYGLESVTNGFILKVDERDKWLVTIASAVSHHPNALIETAEGQLVRGTVVAIDAVHNIAIVKFRNSAMIEPFTLAEEAAGEHGKIGVAALTDDFQLTNITSFVREGGQDEPIIVSPIAIKELLQQALNEPLAWQERAELAKDLQQLPPIGTERVNKIDTYDKETFLYNSDTLLVTVQQFHEQLMQYMKTKDASLIDEMIYSDDLLRKLQSVTISEDLQPINLKSTALRDTIYEVTGEMKTGTGDQKKTYVLTYELIKHQNKWYVVALKFS